jgi:hypothetical protein
MYRTFMSQKNSDFVIRALTYLTGEIGVRADDGSFWVCYGSFVLNQQTPESDLDLLCIHNQTRVIQRIQSSFEGHSVTIYLLNKNDFISDGRQQLLGGYFSGKVLNPYVTFLAPQRDKDIVVGVGGAFIGPFAAAIAKKQGREIATRTNLVADSVLARFYLCPWYRSYFLRYYIAPIFPRLWEKMKETITLSFLESGTVRRDSGGFRYCHTPSNEELHEKTIAAVARFWALGSSLHGGMPNFPVFYIQKAEQFVIDKNLENRCAKMMQFLHKQSIYQDEGGFYGT